MACSHKDGRQLTFKLSAGNRVDELDRGTAREASILQVAFASRRTIRLVTPENAIETRARRPALNWPSNRSVIFTLLVLLPASFFMVQLLFSPLSPSE